MTFYRHLLLLLSVIVLFVSCGSESSGNKESQNEIVLGKIEITDGWARPGMQGSSSAAYLTIVNGTESPDSLIGIFTEVAEVAELHGSYENDAGIISMKPATQPILKAGEVVRFQPGGLHIMLMELNRDLAAGDSLQLTLEFAEAGRKKVTLPVKLP
ncbi:MAG TPA: copper chaperone PCu(A)C [Balneolaceae bacterium]